MREVGKKKYWIFYLRKVCRSLFFISGRVGSSESTIQVFGDCVGIDSDLYQQ